MFEPWKPHREVKERKPLWDYSGCIGSENDAAAENKPSSAVRAERTEIPKEANDDMTVLLVQTDLGEMMSETNTLLRQFAASQSCEVMRWGGGWVLLAPSASAGARTGSILQRRLHQVSAGERPEGEELRSCHIGIHTGKRNNDPTQPPFIDVVATASVAAHHCTGSQVMMSGSTSGQLTPQELERYGAVFRGSTTVDGQGSVDFYELTTPEAERQVNGRASVYVLFAALLEWLTADSPAEEPASAPPPPPEPAAAPSTSAANPDEVAMLCSEEVRLPGARKSNVVAVVPESLTATEEVCRAGEAHPQQQQHQASHHDEVVQDAVVVPQQAWEVVEPRQTQPHHQHVITPRTEHDVVVYPLFAEEIRMPGATQSVLHPVQNTAAPQPTPPLTARWMPEEEANVQPLFAEEVKMPGASMSVRRAIEEDALGNPFPLHAVETRVPVARAPITEHNNAGQDPTFYSLPQVDAPPRTEEVYVPQLPLRAIEVRAPYAAASVVQTLSQPTLDVIEPPVQHERQVAYLHPPTEEVYVPPLPLRAIEVRAPYATASVVQTLPQPPRQDAVELPVLWAYEEYPPRFISPNLDQNHWTLAEPQRTEEHEVQPLHAREVRRPSVSHSTIHNRSAMRSRSQRQGSYASLNPPVLRATEFMPPQHRIHTWSTSRDRLHSPTPPPPPPPAQDPQQSASLVQQSFYADEEEGRIVPNGYTHDSLPSRLHPHRQSHNSGHQEQPVEQVSAPTQVNSSPVIPPMEEYGEEVGRREVVAPPTTTAPNPFDRNGREDQWSPRDGDAADRESAATTAMRAPRLRPSTLDEASNAAAWGTWTPPPTIQPVTSEFRNGHPTMHYTSVSRCINCGNGLLFRLVEDTTGRWAYYNDTTDFNMLVRFTLGPRSNFVPLGYTKVYKDVDTGEYKGELWIPPLATSMLLVGHVRGFKMRYKGVPVSRAAAIEGRRFEHEHEQEEVMEF